MAAVAVAIPPIRCMKLRATRSAVRMAIAGPFTVPNFCPRETRSVSRAIHSTVMAGSTCSNTWWERGKKMRGRRGKAGRRGAKTWRMAGGRLCSHHLCDGQAGENTVRFGKEGCNSLRALVDSEMRGEGGGIRRISAAVK